MLRKTILFLVLLLVFLKGLEKTYDYFLRKNPNLKSAYVVSEQIHAEVLFAGPCEPLWMMDPSLFKKYTGYTAYNLSTVHAGFAENLAMLHLYLRHNRPPKFLFLYVTTESMDGAFNVFNTYNFAPFLSDTAIARIVSVHDPEYSRYSVLPFFRYAFYNDFENFSFLQGVRHVVQNRNAAYFPDGYVKPHGITWDGRMEQFMHQWPGGRVFKWNEQEVRDLREMIAYCASKGIKLVLYESPMLNEIKPFVKNRDEIKDKITNLAFEYKVPYWTFDTMKISESRENFFSILNTNDKGTAIFNKTFADYFKSKLKDLKN